MDTPLQSYLSQPLSEIKFSKEWRGFGNLKDDNRLEKITARMCLSHTTGFPNWRWLTKNGEFYPEGDIRLISDPGARYSYSGEGINLLQFVVEEITGKDLEALAQERIFGPLDMKMTSYVWQERFEGQFCLGHTMDQKVIPKDREDEAGAAGSMETTLDDYTRFITEIFKLSSLNSKITDRLFEKNINIIIIPISFSGNKIE